LQRERQQQQQSWISLRAPSIHSVRDCVVAPITEEWCFRACMVPLLWMEVRQRNPCTGVA
jgi:hypothetical protein